MKIRNLIITLSVFIINGILGIVFYFKNADEISVSTCVLFIIFSYIMYAFLNFYLFVLCKLKQDVNSELLTFAGTFVCTLSFIYFITNIKNDPVLYLPMMYIISLLGGFINYIIYRIKKR